MAEKILTGALYWANVAKREAAENEKAAEKAAATETTKPAPAEKKG